MSSVKCDQRLRFDLNEREKLAGRRKAGMYWLILPTPRELEAFRISQIVRPTFQTTAMIPEPPPAGFRVNRGMGRIGQGQEEFEAAVDAIRHWEMFPGDWVRVETAGEPVRLGQIAAVVARCCRVWTVNCCRVVDVTETDRSIGFTYATTDEHALAGAERFWVERRPDDSVWLGIHSIARPREVLAWLTWPLVKRMQKRFVQAAIAATRDSIARRLEAAKSPENRVGLSS